MTSHGGILDSSASNKDLTLFQFSSFTGIMQGTLGTGDLDGEDTGTGDEGTGTGDLTGDEGTGTGDFTLGAGDLTLDREDAGTGDESTDGGTGDGTEAEDGGRDAPQA